MKYLDKDPKSLIIKNGWVYKTQSQRPHIRQQLLQEQQGFCAYTERYVTPLDALEIEHFDDRLKNTAKDDYWNWYAVHRWINQKKRKINNFLPILQPYDASVPDRIKYSDGAFRTVNDNDTEAKNLIAFLGFNDPTLAEFRHKHIERVRDLRKQLEDDDLFATVMAGDPNNRSFITVLEAELGSILQDI